jgi:NADPH:quinone reductase
LRARSIDEKRTVTSAFARDVIPLIESSALNPTIDSTFELAEIAKSHERLAANATFGKVVLRHGPA